MPNLTFMDEETRESRSIKIKPSILRNARHVAIEEGKSVGRWIEDAIEEKLKLERAKGLRDPKCGCTFEPFGFIKGLGMRLKTKSGLCQGRPG